MWMKSAISKYPLLWSWSNWRYPTLEHSLFPRQCRSRSRLYTRWPHAGTPLSPKAVSISQYGQERPDLCIEICSNCRTDEIVGVLLCPIKSQLRLCLEAIKWNSIALLRAFILNRPHGWIIIIQYNVVFGKTLIGCSEASWKHRDLIVQSCRPFCLQCAFQGDARWYYRTYGAHVVKRSNLWNSCLINLNLEDKNGFSPPRGGATLTLTHRKKKAHFLRTDSRCSES